MTKKPEKEYNVRLRAYGHMAYAIERLVGVNGNTKEEVLEQIVQEWLSANWKRLSDMGITVKNAERMGHIHKIK